MHEILNRAMAFIANGWGFDHFAANNNQKMKQKKFFQLTFCTTYGQDGSIFTPNSYFLGLFTVNS